MLITLPKEIERMKNFINVSKTKTKTKDENEDERRKRRRSKRTEEGKKKFSKQMC